MKNCFMNYVISLGGSLIVPDNVDYKYLKKFVKFIKKLAKKNKIVVICGGGSIARKYMNVLTGKSPKALSLVGIETTKLNARLVAGLLNHTEKIPDTLNEVKVQLNHSNLVICGSLGVKPNVTTDANAAEVAAVIKAKFVNLTNVNGLYTKDPNKFKDAKFIPLISYKDFLSIISKITFKAGQHFVLDQTATKIITKYKVPTVILNGHDFGNMKDYFNQKKFIGTVVA